jgi:2-methylcitrate dehydratase PrpD
MRQSLLAHCKAKHSCSVPRYYWASSPFAIVSTIDTEASPMTTSAPELTEFVKSPSLTDAIVRFVVDTSDHALPDNARHMARLSLLDWIAVAIAGRDEPVSKIVRKMALDDGGTPEASIVGQRVRLPARAAAMVNGTTSHALDYDDTNFVYVGHPSVAVIPAALAIAEKTGATDAAFIDAALIGMEVASRIGAWLGRSHYEAGFHQTATSGTFGATMAAARLLGLNQKQSAHALGLATTRASGLKSQFGTMGKPFHAGMAAANGVEVATLAAAGFVSNPDGLTCSQGFADTHGGQSDDLVTILQGLGETFLSESVQHKFHACCHGTHAALEALGQARGSHQIEASDVDKVTITVNPRWLGVCNIASPVTGLEAKFSYRLTAAMALTGLDTSALSTFSDDNCAQPALMALRDRVSVQTDASMSDTAAQVRINRHTGETILETHDLAAPMARSERETKVRNKAASLLGRDTAEQLWNDIGDPEKPAGDWLAALSH